MSVHSDDPHSNSNSNSNSQRTLPSATLSSDNSMGEYKLRIHPSKRRKLCNSDRDSRSLLLLTNEESDFGLAPVDVSERAKNQDVLTIRRENSSGIHHHSKRVLKPLFQRRCCGASLETRESHKMPPRHVKWWQVTLFLLNDIIGYWLILYSAIIPGLYGWVLGMFLLVALWPLNVYIVHLMWRCRNVFPGAISIGDLVYYLCQSSWIMYLTFFFVNFTILLTLGYQILAVGSNIIWLSGLKSEECALVFLGLTCVALFPLTQFRTLHSLTIMNGINLMCMICFVGTFMYFLAKGGKETDEISRLNVNVEALSESMDRSPDIHTTLLLGVDVIITAYQYQLLVFEIIAEMKNPKEFPKANLWCTPIVLFVVVGCAAFRYYYQGEDKDLNVVVPFEVISSTFDRSPLAYFGIVCFSIHMLGSCLIRSVVLTRSMQLLIHPESANLRTWKSRIEWAGISLLVLTFAWGMSVTIRATAFMSTISGILSILFSIVLPIILYVLCRRSKKVWYEWVLTILIFLLSLIYLVFYFFKLGWRVTNNDYSHFLANRTRTNLEVMSDCSAL